MPSYYPEGWKTISYSNEMVPENIREMAVPGQIYKNPQTGHTLQKQANGRWKLIEEAPSSKQSTESQQISENAKKILNQINENSSFGPGNKRVLSKLIQTLDNFLTNKDEISWEKEWNGHSLSIQSKTSFGDAISVKYSPKGGFSFKVNGETAAGSVVDRKAQVESALTVRRIFKALIKAVPEKTVIRVAPYTEDGKGEGRTRAYVAIGFSKPRKLGGDMFTIKMPDGSIKPATAKEYKAQKDSSDDVYLSQFSELGSLEGDEEHWYHVMFG